MTMDWDNIKYIFQLPLKWYRWMDNKIRHMYGADFIRVKHDGYNDGLEVGVDYDSFANEVRKIAGQPEDGWVKSVDNNYPDAFGDVRTNSVKGIDSGSQTYYPDEMGIVSVPFSSTVQTVDNVRPDTGGNIQLNAVRSVNDEYYPDEDGNIFLPFSGTVKSVDGTEPDSRGNVFLGALTTLDLANQGAIAGPSYEGDKPVAPMSHNHMMDELSGARDADGNLTYIKTINTTIKPDRNGNVNINLPDTPVGTYLVASVDGIRPTDVSGNVQLSAVRSIKIGDDEILRPDANGQISLDDIDGKVKTVNDIEPDDEGNVDLGYLVYTVNGEGPDAAGNITIDTDNLPGMSDYPTQVQVTNNIENHLEPIIGKLGNLTHDDITDWDDATSQFLNSLSVETAGKIVGLDYVSERYICNVNHGHKSSDIENDDVSGFVTLDTEQTITGEKTFQADVNVADDDGGLFVIMSPSTEDVSLNGESPKLTFVSQQTTGLIEAHADELKIWARFDVAWTVVGGSLSFSASNGTTLKQTGVTQPLTLAAWENQVVLTNQPTDEDEDSLAVATVGYVQTHGGKVKSVNGEGPDDDGNIKLDVVKTVNGTNPDASGNVEVGTVKTVNGTAPDANGNVDVGTVKTVDGVRANAQGNVPLGAVRSVNGSGPDASGNVVISLPSGSVKSVDGVGPGSDGDVSLGAVRVTDVETRGTRVNQTSTYARYVCPTAHGHRAQDVNVNNFASLYDWISGQYAWGSNQTYADYLINNVGMERNLTVDGHAATLDANKNSVVSFGLAANKWLKSDGNGHITYTNDTPIALPSGTTGKSQTVTVVTGLSWNGTQLVASRSNLTYTNGVLTNVAATTNTTINTVAYS